VSEIRVPGTRERLWLGSYAAPEAAAVAHDAAACLLRGRPAGHLNFPDRAACYGAYGGHAPPLSPRSVQRVASDAGMAADAQIVDARAAALAAQQPMLVQPAAFAGIGSAAALGGGGATAQGAAACAPLPPPSYSDGASSSSSAYWSTPSASASASTSRTSSSTGSEQPLVYGDISVDDIEILI
jgi:hypothetical protein